MAKTKSKKKAIDEVLDNFNFEKVHKAMVALDWSWFWTEGAPEIADLRKEARRLLNDVAYSKNYKHVGTGGFKAGRQGGVLYLEFNLATWEESYK